LTIRNSNFTLPSDIAVDRLRDVSCTLRVCGRKKLPFAGYSVVKDHSGLRPEPRLGRSRDPTPRSAPSQLAHFRSLARRSACPRTAQSR